VRPCLLVDELPRTLAVGGRELPIDSNFRAFVLLEALLADPAVAPAQKGALALTLVYGHVPRPAGEAADRLLWFYRGGADAPGDAKAGKAAKARRIYDLVQDAELIYAAFLSQYGIDLCAAPYLHWWKFRALLRALPQDCAFGSVMALRALELGSIADRAQRRRLAQLQAACRIDGDLDGRGMAARAGAVFGAL